MQVNNCERFNTQEKWNKCRSEACRVLQTKRISEYARVCENEYCQFLIEKVRETK